MVNSDYTGLALAAGGLEYEGSMCLSAHVAALGNYRIVFIPLFVHACVRHSQHEGNRITASCQHRAYRSRELTTPALGWGGFSMRPIACLFWVDLRDAMIHYHFHPFCERGDRLSSRS